MYNLTNISNTTSFLGFYQNLNTQVMDGWFGTLILVMLFSIFFLSITATTGNATKGVAASSFISALISIAFVTIGLCSSLPVFVFFIMFGGSLALLANQQ